MALTSRSYQLSATPVTIFAHLLVMAVTILVLVWLLHFRQGLAFKLFHFIALVIGVLGTYAVFKFHNEIGLYDMFTLHSWLGIITICAFGLQWLVGFFTYWFPGAEKSTKATLKPWHKFVGMVIFLLGICTAELGLARVGYFLGHSQEALIVNFTGLLIFLFAVCVSLSVILPRDD